MIAWWYSQVSITGCIIDDLQLSEETLLDVSWNFHTIFVFLKEVPLPPIPKILNQ